MKIYRIQKKCQLLTKSAYGNFLAEIQEAKLAVQKTNRQRLVHRKHDVLVCGDVQKVIKKNKIRIVMKLNTLFL